MTADGSRPNLPAVFDRFRVLVRLSATPIGDRFSSDDPETGRRVLVQLIDPALTGPSTHALAEALHGLEERLPEHAAVAPLVSTGVHERTGFLVYPGEQADDLASTWDAGRSRTLGEIVDALREIGAGLDAAAEVWSWHGALQPNQILVHSTTTLLGIGVAPTLEGLGSVLSTEGPYVAPEVREGQSTSPAADQYALAVIAHEWLTGRLPEDGASLALPFSLSPADIETLSTALARGLHASPGSRFDSCAALIDALTGALGSANLSEVVVPLRQAQRTPFEPAPVAAAATSLALPAPAIEDGDSTVEFEIDPELDHDLATAAASVPTVSASVDLRPPRTYSDLAPAGEWDTFAPERTPAAAANIDVALANAAVGLSEPSAKTNLPDHAGSEPPHRANDARRGPREDPASEETHARELSIGQVVPDDAAADATIAASPVQTQSDAPDVALAEAHADARRARRRTLAVAAALLAGMTLGGIAVLFFDQQAASKAASVIADEPAPAAPVEAPATPGAAPPRDFTDAVVPTPAPDPPTAQMATPFSQAVLSGAPATEAAGRQRRAPSPARPGRLVVQSTPSEADVLVDGEHRGVTPVSLENLALGTHTIVVSRAGFSALRQNVELSASRPAETLDVRLVSLRPAAASAPAAQGRTGDPAAAARPRADDAAARTLTGGLLVESRPAGAIIFINGRNMGNTPAVLTALTPGTYEITLERDGYRSWVTTARVVPGERARVAASLVAENSVEGLPR